MYAHAYAFERKRKHNHHHHHHRVVCTTREREGATEAYNFYLYTCSCRSNQCLLTCTGNLNPIRAVELFMLCLFDWQTGENETRLVSLHAKTVKRASLAMSIAWFPQTRQGTDWFFIGVTRHRPLFDSTQTFKFKQKRAREKRTARCNLVNGCRRPIDRW